MSMLIKARLFLFPPVSCLERPFCTTFCGIKREAKNKKQHFFSPKKNPSGRSGGCNSNCTATILHFEAGSGEILLREALYVTILKNLFSHSSFFFSFQYNVDIFYQITWSGTISKVANLVFTTRNKSPLFFVACS